MGDSLIILTYHESGMGVPEDLSTENIVYRIANYYDQAMGGAVGNGKEIGHINVVASDNLTSDPIPMIADLILSSAISTANQNSADITVDITAKQTLPENVKLHIVITENYINWQETYSIDAANGQTGMYDVVTAILTGSTGIDIPALGSGQTHSYTGSFTNDPDLHNPDSLRITAILQVEDTKEILSVFKTNTSPFNVTPILFQDDCVKKEDLKITFTGNNSIRFAIPSGTVSVQLVTSSGRTITHMDCTESNTTISSPEAAGIYFVRFVSDNRFSGVVKVPLR